MAYFATKGKHTITSPYGMRAGKLHAGVDYVSEPNKLEQYTDKKQWATIKFAGWDNSGGGNMVWWRNDDGTGGYVLHSARLMVKTGQRIAPDQVIAVEGNTGTSTGRHTHQTELLDGNSIKSYTNPNLQSRDMGLHTFTPLNAAAKNILKIGRPDLKNVDLDKWIRDGYLSGFISIISNLTRINRMDVVIHLTNGGDLGAWCNESMTKEYKNGFFNVPTPKPPVQDNKTGELKKEIINILNKY